jgi:hypothetical protein
MHAPFNAPELGRSLEVSLTKDSGMAGIVFLISTNASIWRRIIRRFTPYKHY